MGIHGELELVKGYYEINITTCLCSSRIHSLTRNYCLVTIETTLHSLLTQKLLLIIYPVLADFFWQNFFCDQKRNNDIQISKGILWFEIEHPINTEKALIQCTSDCMKKREWKYVVLLSTRQEHIWNPYELDINQMKMTIMFVYYLPFIQPCAVNAVHTSGWRPTTD